MKGLNSKNEIKWIDAVKGISMISVYLMHSQFYYGKNAYFLNYILNPFYVNAFFFVSGYLFFYKEKQNSEPKENGRNTTKRLNNLLFRLIIPTILFSTLLYLPKSYYYENVSSLSDYFIKVWGGLYFWFTSTLVIAQLILIFLVSQMKFSLKYITIISCILFVAGIILNNKIHGDILMYLPWYWKTGVVYSFVMVLGGLYLKYEKKVDQFVNKFWWAFVILYLLLLFVGKSYHIPIIAIGMGGQCNIMGLACIPIGVILIIFFAKKYSFPYLIRYIGRQSIIFYFFSGVMPSVVSTIILRFYPQTHIILLFIVIIASIVISCLLSIVINKYLVFLLDLRKLK